MTVASDLQVYVVWSHGNTLNNSTMAISRGNYFVKTVALHIASQTLPIISMQPINGGTMLSQKIKKLKLPIRDDR